MPAFLKRDALCLLEGGLEAYILALYGLSFPSIRLRRIESTRYAPIIGLLGTSVELLIKSCLVQAKGRIVLVREDGFYKFGSESIEEFKRLIKDEDHDIEFLWKDSDEPSIIKNSLIDYATKFRMLQTLRAEGFHAGRGTSRDVVIITANDVFNFIQTLTSSRRLNSYLRNVPKPEEPIVDRTAILEDISRRISGASELGDKANLLRAIYLVLPHVPDIEPEWLKTFDRVSIAPEKEDLSYLIRVLSEAHGIHLFKQRGGGEGVPVYVDKNDPNSIPISIQFLRREITQIPEKFYSDIALANGRMKEGILHLPPEDFVLDLFTLGLENTNILMPPGYKLTAQQTWPFVASAISTQGIPRPYWFIINYCDEPQKLVSFLKEATKTGNAYYRKRIDEVILGVDLLTNNMAWKEGHSVIAEIKKCLEFFKQKNNYLPENIKNNLYTKYKPEDSSLLDLLYKLKEDQTNLGDVIQKLIELGLIDQVNRYWARTLVQCAFKHNDRHGILAALRTDELTNYWTGCRKAMRLADLIKFGPIIPKIKRDVV